MLNVEQLEKLLKDKDVQYLLGDIAEAKQSNTDVDIKLFIKKGRIVKKQFTTRTFINK